MSDDPQALLTLTVPALLRLRAAETPSCLALSTKGADGCRDRLTYAQLVQRTEAMASGFAAAGFRPGDRICTFLSNDGGRESFLSALGALSIGAAIVPLNTRYADPEIVHAIELVDPVAVITSRSEAPRLLSLRPGLRCLVVDAQSSDSFEVWPEPSAHIKVNLTGLEPTDPDTLGCLLFTSGTTSRSKAVMHTHRTMIGAGLCCGRALGLRRGDLYQAGWPFFTSSALNLGGMSSWVAGAAFIFESQLDNQGRLRLIGSERGTFYHGVPSVIHFLAEEIRTPRGPGYDLSSLRRIGYGGSAMPPEVIRRIQEHLPNVEQVQIYGLTESGPTGTVLPPDSMWRKLGTIGRAMPFCTVRILDDADVELPPDQEGEIVIQGPGVGVGYFRDPEATAAAFSDRAVRTGDVGKIDGEGYVTFTDRKKDIINRGGLKIASVAVETILYQHPSVLEAAVFSVPHIALGEDVAAAVVAQPGMTVDVTALAEFCRGKIADFAQPRRWLVLPELPKNPMGKVLKTELRARAALGRNIV